MLFLYKHLIPSFVSERNGECWTCRVTLLMSISTTGSFFSELEILLRSETSIVTLLNLHLLTHRRNSSHNFNLRKHEFLSVSMVYKINFSGQKVLKKATVRFAPFLGTSSPVRSQEESHLEISSSSQTFLDSKLFTNSSKKGEFKIRPYQD